MEPFVREGDWLEVEPLDSPPAPGALVLHCSLRQMVCHRILLRQWRGDQYWYYLSGNHPLKADGWTPHYRLTHRVVRVNGELLHTGRLNLRRLWFHWHGLLELYVLGKGFHSPWGRRIATLRRRWIGPRSVFLPRLLQFTAILGGIPRKSERG